MKQIAIFGSTGSIGENTLAVIRSLKKEFKVAALTSNSNIALLYRQIRVFKPRAVCVKNRGLAVRLRAMLGRADVEILVGETGLEELAKSRWVDRVVIAISGSSALAPLLAAIDSGKQVALANKEALVMAGPLIMRQAEKHKALIIPIDSEQSAIWQCLQGEERKSLKRVYLTASGGPLLGATSEELKRVSLKRVLKHPRWRMGKKISVDSATLMNKGLELLEAMYLFGLTAEKIKVLIHPQAIIHSMVEFSDGVLMAQLSATDMRIPIQYALSYPKRLPSAVKPLDFYAIKGFDFEKPDLKRFPCLELAYEAAREGGTAPAVLNAADEVAVEAFLNKRIKFADIPLTIERVLSGHRNKNNPGLRDILAADSWARLEAAAVINRGVN